MRLFPWVLRSAQDDGEGGFEVFGDAPAALVAGSEIWPPSLVNERGRTSSGSGIEFLGDRGGLLRKFRGPVTHFAFYTVVLTLGILSMGFQLLASRLLSPHFGSSLIVWAWLISTFLAAFSAGSMAGGWISNLAPAPRARAQWASAILAVATLAFTATSGRSTLERIEVAFPDSGPALFVSCLGLFFLPVTALSSFGPQCVQFLAARGTPPGKASGLVYAVSTLGNIAGVMLTAFVLIPHFRVSTLLFGWLAVASLGLAGLLRLLSPPAAP